MEDENKKPLEGEIINAAAVGQDVAFLVCRCACVENFADLVGSNISKQYNSINLNNRITQYSDFFENNMIFHEN